MDYMSCMWVYKLFVQDAQRFIQFQVILWLNIASNAPIATKFVVAFGRRPWGEPRLRHKA